MGNKPYGGRNYLTESRGDLWLWLCGRAILVCSCSMLAAYLTAIVVVAEADESINRQTQE
jgi:hypothetical protein